VIKAFFQGKPFGHPLHPALVHFPVGLLLLSLALDLIALFQGGSSILYRAAFYAMAAGAGMGILAAFTGLADWVDIRLDHPAKGPATLHMFLNLAAIALFSINLLLRSGSLERSAPAAIELGLSLLGAGLVLVSGYLGGTLVYDNGIGVGRHRRRIPIPNRTVQAGVTGDSDGWLAVTDEGSLVEGATLRVSCQGTVIVLARQGNAYYAFQEFCTHRYGPLSEGPLENFSVECPWHRSCFDIRTGQVVEGPAKAPLHTYPVKVEAGKILIRCEPKAK
jgi:nitrite reductase/ring-hydroxylating ferredoxin subunit/uncharacterized membrane protein